MPHEQNANQHIMKALRDGGLDPVRVENRIGAGTPDINYTLGWIETKTAAKWPKDGLKPLVLNHPMTIEQRNWHIRRTKAGGDTWVMIKLGRREYLLLTGMDAADKLGHSSKPELLSLAAGYWPKGLNQKEFIECLRS